MEKIFCKECDAEFYLSKNLGKHIKHIKQHNLTREDYYIKWNKKYTH